MKFCTKCNRENCKSYHNGQCTILINTNFGQRGCSFFKDGEYVPDTKGEEDEEMQISD